jgi:hypothetical protein
VPHKEYLGDTGPGHVERFGNQSDSQRKSLEELSAFLGSNDLDLGGGQLHPADFRQDPPAIRAAWETAKAAELMADVEKQKQLLQTDMAATLATEWDKAKDQIKQDWEKR